MHVGDVINDKFAYPAYPPTLSHIQHEWAHDTTRVGIAHFLAAPDALICVGAIACAMGLAWPNYFLVIKAK